MLDTSKYSNLTDHLIQIDKIYKDTQSQKMAEAMYPYLFDVIDKPVKNYTMQILHGAYGIKKKVEWGRYAALTTWEWDKVTFQQSTYGGSVAITKESKVYDDYDLVYEQAKTSFEDMFDKIDQWTADMILHWFTTTAYTDVYDETVSFLWADWLQLFSAVHTNWLTSSKYSNLCISGWSTHPAFGYDGVNDTRVAARKYKNPQWQSQPMILDTIIVWPALETLAYRLALSDLIPWSDKNDVNPLKGKLKVMVWDRLAEAYDWTDASLYWFMADSRYIKNTLKMIYWQRPWIFWPRESRENSLDKEIIVDTLYAQGFGFQKNLWGSKWDSSVQTT